MAYDPYSQTTCNNGLYPCPDTECDQFYIYTDPEMTVEFVEFDYGCEFDLETFAWLCVEGEPTDIRYLTECPCTWKLNRKVRELKLVLSRCVLCSCAHTGVVYKCPEGWLKPGDKYNIIIVPGRPVSSIGVTWESGGSGAKGALYLDGVIYGTAVDIPDTPGSYSWGDIERAVSSVYIEISGGCANVIEHEVVYSEEWIPIAPGASYPLPDTPPEISRITFEAKTDAGTTSQISALVYGNPLCGEEASPTPQTLELVLTGGPYPVDNVSLTITGSSTVYIRNLTTE